MPRNVRDGVRMSTALTYLGPARSRPNLDVRADAVVDRVELTGGRATRVRLVGGEVVRADTVVLATGAYASPAILLRVAAAGSDPGLGLFPDRGQSERSRRLGLRVVRPVRQLGADVLDDDRSATFGPARFRSVDIAD
jgi:glycine/D-amino acid oxidase-like deaminating enzyme